MMLFVADFAVLLFVGSTLWQRHRFLEAAALHASLEQQFEMQDRFIISGPKRVEVLNEAAPLELSAYHAMLKLKYQKAARRPWLVVEPDPPAPGR